MVHIVDCFMFNDELELLELRLKEHWDYVSDFILVESKYTFSGKSKPLYYELNKNKFEEYNSKIHHVIIEEFPPHLYDTWSKEKYQRDYPIHEVNKLHYDDIFVISSDTDEIFNQKILQDIKNKSINHTFGLTQDLYIYNFKNRSMNKWHGPIGLPYNNILNVSFHDIRFNHWKLPKIDGGWHLTYFMSAERILSKIQSFSHQELNTPEIANLEYIKTAMQNPQVDLYKRDLPSSWDIGFNPERLPKNYEIMPKIYYED